jgi:hypothetical protein
LEIVVGKKKRRKKRKKKRRKKTRTRYLYRAQLDALRIITEVDMKGENM